MIGSDISIIIVSFNSSQFISECLSSLLNQSSDVREITVIDNASGDNTVELIRNNFPQIKLIENFKNLGFAKALNSHLNHTDVRYILVLNPDILIPANCLNKLIKYMDENLEVGVLSPKLIRPDGSLDWACRRSFPSPSDIIYRYTNLDRIFSKSSLFSKYSLSYLDQNNITEVDGIAGAFMLIRANALPDVGAFDERFFMYFEDLDWCYRLKKCGWKVLYYPLQEVIHYKRGSSVTNESLMIREFYYSLFKLYDKYYGSSSNEFKRFSMWMFLMIRMLISLCYYHSVRKLVQVVK